MAHLAWFQERKRLYLLSYNELLYLLKKYPKRNPYAHDETTKDQFTQTSPRRFTRYCVNRTYKNITFINDTDTTAVMTPSPASKLHKSKANAVSPASSTTTTVIMSPSPDTKRKRHCDPKHITPSPFTIRNTNNNGNSFVKSVHETAKKASHSLLNNLIDPNDSENDTEHRSQSIHKTKRRMKRKRSFQQFNDTHTSNGVHTLTKTLSQCSIDDNNRPLKRRKKNGSSPKKSDIKHRTHRKSMLLQYYNMNKGEYIKDDHLKVISPIKPTKPKLLRSSNASGINTYRVKDVYNSKIKRKLVFSHDTVSFEVSNSYESIESLSPRSIHPLYPSKKTKTDINIKKRKKKSKAKMSTIPRRLQHKEEVESTQKKENRKTKRRRCSLTLQEAPRIQMATDKAADDATFFGLLPELDEQEIKGDTLVNSVRNEVNVEYEEKQMSHNEIIRFENISSPRYGRIEEEWKAQNESIPDSNGSDKLVIIKQHRYTPLWRASTKLPSDEKHFDAKRLKASNDPHPLNRFSDEYLNSQDISPTTKLAQDSMRSDVVDYTHSQIVAKYQENVSCFGNNNMESGEYSGSKESLFDNTDFSADRRKVNSLLGESNTEHDEKYFEDLQIKWRDKVQKNKNKYSVFEYPKD